jgi:magnesium-transporting ATPase (P-type)
MVIIGSSDREKGKVYVETKNLDGETNKKIRFLHQDMLDLIKHKEDPKALIPIYKD